MAETIVDVVVALDWTPNTNHVGFYVAKALGYYKELGLSVDLLSPFLDRYEVTPASRVATKAATFALAPSETVISYHLPPHDVGRSKLVALATILQEDLSAIVTLKESGILRPKQLDGRLYASYGARFEGRIVQRLIQADGGKGQFTEITPEKLGIWNTLVNGKADATWIFKGWEGVEAQLKKIDLNKFTLADYGIPYGFSPVIVCHPDTIQAYPDVVTNFLRATKKGFAYAAKNIDQASILLSEIVTEENPSLPNPLDPVLVLASLEYLSKHFFDESGNWGVMASWRWEKFLQWLSVEGLLTTWIQSRTPVPGLSVSLDELRTGNAGDAIQLSELKMQDLYSNDFLT